MRKTIAILAVALLCSTTHAFAQKQSRTVALPPNIYDTLRQYCTQLDVVFITGLGGSISMDNNKSISGFTTFVTQKPADKKTAPEAGTIMWQINGNEYLMGNFFLTGDSSGYIVFNKNNKEYVNALSPSGAGFLAKVNGK